MDGVGEHGICQLVVQLVFRVSVKSCKGVVPQGVNGFHGFRTRGKGCIMPVSPTPSAIRAHRKRYSGSGDPKKSFNVLMIWSTP